MHVEMIPVLCSRISAVAVFACVVLTGCAVGPNFQPPAAPSTKTYTERALPPETEKAPGPGGAAQRFTHGKDIPGQWWTLFHSEMLDRLIRRALARSPTLAAARATLRQAMEARRAQFGALFPRVDAGLSATREKITGASFGQDTVIPEFSLFHASLDITYALDIFGGTRRQLEALQSQIDYQRFQLEGAHLTLTSNIVSTAVQEASLRSQIRSTREILTLQEEQLAIIEKQFELGGVAAADVLAQKAQVSQTRAALPPLQKQLAQTRHLLAVLSGSTPGEAELPEFELDGFVLPQELPVSLPSSLVRQRPDILASEALLHAASAQVGVATANLYPQITLTGSYGSEATGIGKLFGTGSTVWNFGAGLLQPIFHGGTLTAQRRAAVAAYEQALAQYRVTVLQAFQNVADVLRALEADAGTLKAQKDTETAAFDSLDLTKKQFRLGGVSYLSLLNAQRQYQQARISLVQARSARFADTAALFQALGGGWWNRSRQDNTATITDNPQ